MEYQRLLFDTPESLTFDRVRDQMQPIIPDLWNCISNAFSAFVQRIESGDEDFLEMTVGERAQFFQPAIRRRLRKAFGAGNAFGARLVRSNKLNLLIYEGIAIRIKKFRSDLSISNYRTSAADNYWRENPTASGILRVVFGYKPTPMFTQMTAFVTMPLPGAATPHWFGIEDQTAILLDRKVAEVLAESEQPKTRRSWRVKPKKDSSKETGGKDAAG